MAKEFSINVPILAIQPADQIIDYLNGKASLAIVNPYFQLPGVPKANYANFLAIKTLNSNGRNGYQIVSPQIVYKTQAGTFTSKIVFNDDDGSSDLTTYLRFYALKDKPLTLESYNKEVKVLQKIVASRGVVKDSNSQLIRECVINYQLSQAFELALLIKMTGVKPTDDDNDLSILTKINIMLNSDNLQNRTPNPATTQKIEEYIRFNTVAPNTEDKRFIKSYNQTKLNSLDDSDLVKQSIISIFTNDMKNKSKKIAARKQNMQPAMTQEQQQQQALDNLFELYNNVLRIPKYQNMGAACYVKEYEGTAANSQSYSGSSFYTDYTFKIANKSTQKTMIRNEFVDRPRIMTVNDYLDLVADTTTNPPTPSLKPIVAKLFMGIDFDFRVYQNVTMKQAINVRYVVHLIFCKQSTGNGIDNIDYSGVDMPVEFSEGAGQAINYNMEDVQQQQQPQQSIPIVPAFSQQGIM